MISSHPSLKAHYAGAERREIPASTNKPQLLVIIYSNPDYYPPTVFAVSSLREYFEVVVLCRNMAEPIYDWPDDVRLYRLGRFASPRDKETANAFRKLSEYANFVRAVSRTIRIVGPRALYVYDAYAFAAVLLGRVGRGLPIIFHAHEHVDLESLPPLSLQTWIVRYAIRNARKAALVVQPEKYRALYYMRMARDARPPVVVPNCPSRDLMAHLPDFADLVERRWRNREVLFTATLGRESGVLQAISAFAKLGGCARLRLYGSIPERNFESELWKLARGLGLADRISYEGFLPLRKLMVHTLNASLGLVLYQGSTMNSTFNASATNKLFEYAARGIPAVVPDRESFREFLAGESWVAYADPANPESIATAVQQVFEDHARYITMCQAARRAFEEKYNYENLFAPVMRRIIELTSSSACQRYLTSVSR